MADPLADAYKTGHLPVPSGLYTGFVFLSAACGMLIGVTSMVGARDNALFIPALVASLLLPIACSAALGGLGWAAARGSRRSFYASWIVAAAYLIPAAIFVYVLVLGRRPLGLFEELPQMAVAEVVGLASLVACFVSLGAVVVLGFRVRTAMRRGI